MLIASRLLLLLGRLEECGRLIERAVRAEPQSRDVHFEYARLLLKKGEAAEAAREGEIALRLTQGGIPERQVRYVLVRSYQAAGEERKAAEHAAALQKLEAH
jgi:predicted Zn-dependent protease